MNIINKLTMSTECDYMQADFTNTILVDLSDLQGKIAAYNYSSATIQYINCNGSGDSNTSYQIYFDRVISVTDKASLDTLIANYYFVILPDSSCVIRDIKPFGTNGGTFNANTWVTRTLNRIDGYINFATLNATNQFTLQPGTYTITIQAPACNVQSNRVRLRNLTQSTFTLGSTAYAANDSTTNGNVQGYYVLTTASVFDVQHICAVTSLNTGFGRGTTGITIPAYTAPAQPAPAPTPTPAPNQPTYTPHQTYTDAFTYDGANLDEVYTKVFITRYS